MLFGHKYTPALAVLSLCTLPALAATHAKHVKVRPDGETPSVTTLYNFTANDGTPVGNLIQAKDGNFYGVTQGGPESGELYQLTPGGNFSVVYAFNSAATAGFEPEGEVFQGMDGNLYGIATSTVSQADGLYVYNIARKALLGFYLLLNTSSPPQGFYGEGLTQDAQGNLYFVLNNANDGVLIKVVINSTGTYPPPAPTVTQVAQFLDNSNGLFIAFPVGTPVVASNGNVYGHSLGRFGSGVWQYVPSSGALSLIGYLPVETTPVGGLQEAEDGNVYGTYNNPASLYKINLSTAFANTYATYSGANENTNLYSGTPAVSYYDIYTAGDGGANGDGTVTDEYIQEATGYHYDFYDFTNGADGGAPEAEPAFGTLDGGGTSSLIGTTTTGGTTGLGTIYAAPFGYTPPVSLETPTQTIQTNSPIELDFSLNGFSYSQSATTCYAYSSDYTFSGPLTLTNNGATYSGSVNVTPTTTGTKQYAVTCGGNQSATLTIPVNNGNINITDSYNNANTNLNYNVVPSGNQADRYITITNPSTTALPVSVSLSGKYASMFAMTNSCPASLQPGNSCSVYWLFTAPSVKAATAYTATFTIAKNGFVFSPGNTGTLTATAAPAGQITVSSNSHSFGSVSAPVSYTFNVYNGTGATQSFSQTATQVSGPAGTVSSSTTCPATLGITQSCSVTVSFSTNSAGAFQVNDVVTSSAAVKPEATVKLTGTAE